MGEAGTTSCLTFPFDEEKPMARYLVRRLGFTLLTMLLVSLAIFAISEIAPGDMARHILGQFATPEQVQLLREQMGLNQPLYIRYLDWLVGNDWRVYTLVGKPLALVQLDPNEDPAWWAQEADGTLKQWRMKPDGLVEIRLTSDGKRQETPFNGWQTDE